MNKETEFVPLKEHLRLEVNVQKTGKCNISRSNFYIHQILDLFINSFSLQPVKVCHWNVSNEGVQLVLCSFFFVSLARKSNPDATWNALDALFPDGFVEHWINANVAGAHGFGGKGLDGFNGAWSTRLSCASVNGLSNVDGIFTSNNIGNNSFALVLAFGFLDDAVGHWRMDGWMDRLRRYYLACAGVSRC